MQNDTEYISKFLDYYLNSLDNNYSKVSTYEEKIVSVIKKFSKFDSLQFTDLVDRSYLYQYLILHENESPIKFLHRMAFRQSKHVRLRNGIKKRRFLDLFIMGVQKTQFLDRLKILHWGIRS